MTIQSGINDYIKVNSIATHTVSCRLLAHVSISKAQTPLSGFVDNIRTSLQQIHKKSN